jgi:hypothetical protein
MASLLQTERKLLDPLCRLMPTTTAGLVTAQLTKSKSSEAVVDQWL